MTSRRRSGSSLLRGSTSRRRSGHMNSRSPSTPTNIPGEVPTPECQKCKKTVLLKDRLVHLVGHISRDEEIHRFRCAFCKYEAGFAGNLRYHTMAQHNTKDGIVDRIEELSEHIKRMSLICYLSPVVLKARSGSVHQPSVLRASWPRDRCKGRDKTSSANEENNDTLEETPDADDTESADDARMESDESEMDVSDGNSEQNASGVIDGMKNENRMAQDSLTESVKIWANLQAPNFDFAGNSASTSYVSTNNDETETPFTSGMSVPSTKSANSSTWKLVSFVKREVDFPPEAQVQPMPVDCGAKMAPKGSTVGDSSEVLDDEEFYETHRLQKKWNKKELVDNIRIVARRMECSEERIDFIVSILEKNDMDGIALSFEDENLTNFFGQCNVAYGARSVMIQILRKMKIGQLNNGN